MNIFRNSLAVSMMTMCFSCASNSRNLNGHFPYKLSRDEIIIFPRYAAAFKSVYVPINEADFIINTLNAIVKWQEWPPVSEFPNSFGSVLPPAAIVYYSPRTVFTLKMEFYMLSNNTGYVKIGNKWSFLDVEIINKLIRYLDDGGE